MQKMRNCADLCVEIIDQRSTVSNGADGFAEPLQIGFDSRQIHSQRNQHLADTVVQFAGDAPALVILQVHETCGEVEEAAGGRIEVGGALVDSVIVVGEGVLESRVVPSAGL